MRFTLIFFFVVLCNVGSNAQYVDIKDIDEGSLYAQTKQVNQFIRRFNNQEDMLGKRENLDSIARNNERRKGYIQALFNADGNINKDMKSWFLKEVTQKGNPIYLDFHRSGLLAEVETKFNFKGKQESAILFLKLEHERLGYKWVLVKVYFAPFKKMFFADGDTANHDRFLHPLSHEIDFMNLHKVFRDKDQTEYYTQKGYIPDYLTLFLYELKNSNLRFESVSSVKFHFLQVPDWYFELSYYNRPGNNSGWLISNLLRIKESEKENLTKIIYHE